MGESQCFLLNSLLDGLQLTEKGDMAQGSFLEPKWHMLGSFLRPNQRAPVETMRSKPCRNIPVNQG